MHSAEQQEAWSLVELMDDRQLRSEVVDLRGEVAALKAELAALEQCHDDNCRAEEAEAELATERARLDHVLKSDWPFRNRDEIDKDIKEAAK